MLKSNNFFSLSREATLVVIGQLVTFIATIYLVGMLTRYISPSVYGKLTLLMTLSSIILLVVVGGLGHAVGRHYTIAAQTGQLTNYFSATNRLIFQLSILISSISLVGYLLLSMLGYQETSLLFLFTVLLSLVVGINGTYSGLQNGARNRGILIFHSSIEICLRIVITYVTMERFGASVLYIILSYLAASSVVVVLQFIFAKRTIAISQKHGRIGENSQIASVTPEEWYRNLLRYSWPYNIWGISTWLQMSSDRWALEAYVGTKGVGQYAALFQIAYTPIVKFSSVFTTFLGPVLFDKMGVTRAEKENKLANRIIWTVTTIGLVATGALFICSFLVYRPIFQFIVSAQYWNVGYLFPWLVLSGGIFATGQILVLKLESELLSKSIIGPKTATAVVGVTMNYLGAMFYGIEGIVMASVGTSIFYLMVLLLAVSDRMLVYYKRD